MRRFVTLIVLFLMAACCPAAAAVAATPPPDNGSWVGTWAAAANGGVSEAGYAGYTIRNLVHTSIGGERVRVKLSNAFGTKPVLFAHTTVGLQRVPGSAVIAPGTLRDVTFGGQRAVTVPAGAELYSDPVDLPLAEAADLFVTTYTPDPSGPVTYHYLGLATSFYATDGTDHAGDLGAGGLPSTTRSWHYVTEVDVQPGGSAAGAVVALGDSITDGDQSTPDTDRRWPDRLAARLSASHGTAARFGVLNAGIAGNRVLLDGAGERATARLDRDVLQRAGVRTVVVLEGINDILQGQHDPDRIIAGLREIADRAHAAGLRVIGGTLTPFGGFGPYDADKEAAREGVNSWIRSGGVFDAVVDFDAAVRDPADPQRMLPRYDSGDHLHPGDAGYQAMADAIDLRALGRPGPVRPVPPTRPERSLTVGVGPERTVAIAGRAATVSLTSRVTVQGPGTVRGSFAVIFDGVRQEHAFAVRSQGRFAQLDLTRDVRVPVTTAAGTHRITVTVRTRDGGRASAVATVDVERVGCEQSDDACALDLDGTYDRDAIASAARPDDGDFDGLGWSYAAETLPAPGPVVLAGTPFGFPSGADGVANTVTAHGQTLALPALRARELRLLGAASSGAVDDVATVTYTDGSTAPLPLRFSDWASGPQVGEDVAVAAPYRYRAGVGRDGPPVDIYARTIPLDPDRTVRSLTLPDQTRLKLFAVTLRQNP
ncbi:SGNH/GDSL hydrolase family protein [Streptomyces sp. NPDC047072]|uniref:SGNH/GDSL hydrolase family protein n=1 Tax=Streptomyces sp. NPDC047072 TaxID=3154809 RepID=UPI00340C74D1